MNTEKKRKLAFAGASLLVAAGLGTLIYYQAKGIQQRRAEVAALRRDIEEDKKLLQQTPELVKKVIIQRETDAVVKEILSDEKDVTDLARTLNKFSQDSGFTLSSVKDGTRTQRKNKEDFERVSFSLAFEADAFQLLTFLSKIEGYARFSSVTQFKLQAANRNEYSKDTLPRHKVTLDLETYVYAPTGAAKEVKIDHYDKKKELLISEISRRAAELRVPAYDYRGQRGRRDPWIDPRVPVDGGPQMPIEEQISLVDELSTKAVEIQKVWDEAKKPDITLIESMKLRADLEQKLALLEEEIRRVDLGGFLVFVPALRRFDKNVVASVAAVREQMNKGSGEGATTALLRETSEAMERHIDAQEYELALAAFNTVESRLGLADQDPLKGPLVKSLRELKHLAETVLEFDKIEIHVQGVALYQGRAPVALINGQPYAEGEMLGEELIVHHILADQIEFAFRGLILARTLETRPTG
ncbi:MAG: hypothetical protein EXS08_04900 [Planctomycetes bacterium]|nr:hypothetical protein [Planctomycetota bacterium]